MTGRGWGMMQESLCSNGSRETLKRRGARGSPCLTPAWMGMDGERWLFRMRRVLLPLVRARVRWRRFSGRPWVRRVWFSHLWETLS